jgi:hypothetical protein
MFREQHNIMKGIYNVVGDCNFTRNPLAAGICKQLHDGRLYQYFAGNCGYCSTRRSHSATESHTSSEISETKSTITKIECFPSWETIIKFRRKPVSVSVGLPCKSGFARNEESFPQHYRTFPLPQMSEQLSSQAGFYCWL